MTDKNRATSIEQWTSAQAYIWRSSACWQESPVAGWSADPRAQRPRTASAPAAGNANAAIQPPTPAQMQETVDTQAGPLLEKLKADPANAGLLENIGNVYYDAQRFPIAIDYYQRALKVEPANTSVRTDMATAYWYTGNADAAIAEFQKSLLTNLTTPTLCSIWASSNGRARWTSTKLSPPGKNCWTRIRTMRRKIRFWN